MMNIVITNRRSLAVSPKIFNYEDFCITANSKIYESFFCSKLKPLLTATYAAIKALCTSVRRNRSSIFILLLSTQKSKHLSLKPDCNCI